MPVRPDQEKIAGIHLATNALGTVPSIPLEELPRRSGDELAFALSRYGVALGALHARDGGDFAPVVPEQIELQRQWYERGRALLLPTSPAKYAPPPPPAVDTPTQAKERTGSTHEEWSGRQGGPRAPRSLFARVDLELLFALVERGRSNEEIAAEMGIHPNTVAKWRTVYRRGRGAKVGT